MANMTSGTSFFSSDIFYIFIHFFGGILLVFCSLFFIFLISLWLLIWLLICFDRKDPYFYHHFYQQFPYSLIFSLLSHVYSHISPHFQQAREYFGNISTQPPVIPWAKEADMRRYENAHYVSKTRDVAILQWSVLLLLDHHLTAYLNNCPLSFLSAPCP